MCASVTVSATVEAPISLVWDCWNKPEHIVNWYSAQESVSGVDLDKQYSEIDFLKKISYKISEDKKVDVSFSGEDCNTVVTETVNFENTDFSDQQKRNLQRMLDHFKKYAEVNFDCSC